MDCQQQPIPNLIPNNRIVKPIIPFPPPSFPPRFPTSNIPPPPLPPRFLSAHLSTFPFPPYTFPGQTSTAGPCPTVSEEPLSELKSQQIVDSWLKSNKYYRPQVKRINKDVVKINKIKEKVNAAFKIIKELENDSRTLNVMVKTVTPSEWNKKLDEIELKKHDLLNTCKQLKLNEAEVAELKEKCFKRSKKRARLRRQALRRKVQKENDIVNRQNLNFRIENWQKEMQEIVERSKREQELQQEADAVLWGVRQRKAEARRQLDLLTTLEELRETRVRRRSAAGQASSPVDVKIFNTVIDRLKVMWTRRLSECKLEEQALRGMLAQADVTQDPVSTFKKLVLKEWSLAIFGCSSDTPRTDPSLVDIRRSWDQFVVGQDTVLASTVPPGWVMPCPPSSDHWKSLLKY